MNDSKVKKIKYAFSSDSVAIIGASTTPNKVGNVILRNLIDGKYQGKVYPVNPAYHELLGLKCYPNVLAIPEKVVCAIIATPAETVPMIVEQCGKKKIPVVVVISGGFAEVGNRKLEEKLGRIAERYKIALIGPNCLGVFDPYARIDSIFLPMYKLERPKPGGISFITQSGAVGSCTIDMAAHYGIGISKFISYGNGTDLTEADYLRYLVRDKNTKTIILYIEGVKNGKEFFTALKEVNRKKPIIVLKAGKYGKAVQAAMSHTGNIAGEYATYNALFKQTKVIEAETLEELFDFVRIFTQPLPKGKRVGVITNGGGIGVLTSDALESNGLEIVEFETKTKKELRKILPLYANITNPLDLVADAGPDKYDLALQLFMGDKNVDIILAIVLTQTPPIDERIIGIITKVANEKKKPVVVITVGGRYSDNYRRILEGYGVPTYNYPEGAVKAVRKLVEYANFRKNLQ